MKWSLLLPTRGRPEGMQSLIDSLAHAAVMPEIVFRFDDDDPGAWPDCVKEAWGEQCRVLYAPRAATSTLYNECAAAATGDLLMLVADDMEFRTPGWDKIIEAQLPDDGIFCAWPHDGHQGHCTFPIVSRKWYETLGYFLPPCLEHAWVDTWLSDIAGRLGRAIYVPDVLCEHNHFSFGKSEMDENYAYRRRDNCDRIREDMQTYNDNGELRQMAADKLRGLME